MEDCLLYSENNIKIGLTTTLVHSIFLFQILTFLFTINTVRASIIYFTFCIIIFLFYIVSVQKVSMNWDFKSLQANGFFFILYYLIMILFGGFYGYTSKYIIANVIIVLPLFSFMILPLKNRTNQIYNIIIFYSTIALILSYIEYFAWENIPFLKHFILNSIDENGNSPIIDKEGIINPFGFYNIAVQNGYYMIFSIVILIEKTIYKFKFKYIILIFFFTVGIFLTTTRNNYMSLFVAILVLLFLYKHYKIKYKKWVYMFMLFGYISIIMAAIYYTMSSDDGDTSGLNARIFSWNIIINDYMMNVESVWKTFFGYGITQIKTDFSPEVSYWFIDNSLLSIYMVSGYFGILLFVLWIKSAIDLLYSKYNNYNKRSCYYSNDCRQIRILMTMIVTLFINGTMNGTFVNSGFVLILLILLTPFTRNLNQNV